MLRGGPIPVPPENLIDEARFREDTVAETRDTPGDRIEPDRWNAAPHRLADELRDDGYPTQTFSVPSARDPVDVLPFPDGGGLVSYRKPDGGWLHTLCDDDGFRRKLEMLGISR